jgi:hypothetical protein
MERNSEPLLTCHRGIRAIRFSELGLFHHFHDNLLIR